MDLFLVAASQELVASASATDMQEWVAVPWHDKRLLLKNKEMHSADWIMMHLALCGFRSSLPDTQVFKAKG